MVVSDFWSWLVELEAPPEVEPLSLLEPEVAPLPAVPLAEPLELGVDDEAPPPDWLFWSELVEDELDGEELDGVEPMLEDDEDEPEGEVDGVEVAPLEDVPDGVDDDGLVAEEPAPLWLPPRSQAVRSEAPSARETAIANLDTFMGPPWLG